MSLSIHPDAIRWMPAPAPRNGVGRDTSIECRLGFVWKSASGLWQATRTDHGSQYDCGEHKTIVAAKRAVENWRFS